MDVPPPGAPGAPYRANRRERWKCDVDGALWLWCNDGEHWLPVERFRLIGSKRQRYNSLCRTCENERSVAWQKRNPERAREFARRHEAKVTPAALERADRAFLRWLRENRRMLVPLEEAGPVVDLLIERGIREHETYETLAHHAGMDSGVIRRLRRRAGRTKGTLLQHVDRMTLERLASAIDAASELPLLLPGHFSGDALGVDSWNAAGDRHCTSCGSWFHPHRAQGLCHRCYGPWRRNGFRDPGYLWYERALMWSFIHRIWGCIDCGTDQKRHAGRGRCTTCKTRHDRRQQKADQLPEGDRGVLVGSC